jgi:hypothetical protein
MSMANNGMRVLTSDELDVVTGGTTVIEINMGPVKIQMWNDPDMGQGAVIWNGQPRPSLSHEPVHVGGPRPA